MLFRKTRWSFVTVILGLANFANISNSSASGAGPVIVELFTSEGCSSCPPADDLLSRTLREDPNIAGMSEHVDYWNHLGWRDPNSAAIFSERQSAYAKKFGLSSVYTPQMIINGTFQEVGNKAPSVKRMLELGLKNRPAPLAMTCETKSLEQLVVRLKLDKFYRTGCSAHISVTEDDIISPVARGENGGIELHHDAVVRHFFTYRLDGTSEVTANLRLQNNWKKKNLKVVGFVQEPGPGKIIASCILRVH